MTKFFLSAYDYFSQRRGALFTLLSLLVVLLALSAYHIRFKEDISRFLPENKENERINNAYQYVASSNTITVYCNFKLPETGGSDMQSIGEQDIASDGLTIAPPEPSGSAIDVQTAAVDALAERLQARMDASYVKSMFYCIDPTEMLAISSFVIDNMPYFLDEDDYGRMDTLLTREAIARQLLIDKNVLVSSAGMIVRNNFLHDPLQMTGGLMRKLQNFRVGDQFRLYDDHLFNEENQAILFIDCAIPASETGANAIFLDSLNSFIAETEKEFDNITFDSFGASEIGLTNARQIRKDTMFSMTLAMIVMFALLIYSFRSVRKIVSIFTSVLFGGLFALAMLNIIGGDASIIAVGISSIMFGIAINYPLHFMEHYSRIPDSRIVIKDITEPLTIGNMTTAGAFMSLVFIGSDAMKDLGLFASLLLIGTILFVLFFLPHFLTSRRKEKTESLFVEDKSLSGRFFARPFEKNRRLVFSVILLTIFFSFFSGNYRFETDMQKINYMTASQKKSFEKMMGLLNKNQHAMYYITEGKDLEAALEANESRIHRLQSLVEDGDVYRIGGVGVFFPSRARQTEQIKRWENFWSTRRDSVMTFLHEESQKTGFREDAFQTFEDRVDRKWEAVDLSHFNPIRETLAGNYIIEKEDKAAVVNMLYTDASKARELEEKLNDYASSSIAFDAGSITRRMISSLSDNFNYVLYVCGIIVFVFLIFSLGRIELSLIAFLPLALSWIWILGMMNIFDIRFNIVNIILATFIFGQGDDYTIFMTEGLMYEYAYRRKMLASYKKSIALSALIMFVGMGMLIFAKHPALRSLAEVTIVGMFSVVIMAYIFPSLLFRLLTMKKDKKRLIPVTFKNLLCTIYSFLFFLIMSAIITVIGWMTVMSGRTTEKKKRKYHKLLYRIANFVIYHIPQVKTTFRNLSGETFDKPAVIICNHQAHLDLMCIMMLTPKLIILTNEWAWNSPFYGKLIKYADFYPVSNGIENAIDQLQDAVNRGYSIVIFPEGTRSADCSIKRFHRGAFYLAEQLNLDIIPVMIHGAGHVLPKDEFMLRKGRIHIQVMPGITYGDERFRKNYSLRSKDVRHYYQAEYKKLSKELETPEYYADLVLKNYIYKGPAIERAVRRNLKRHNNYAAEIAAMPDEGELTIRNAGYGEYALLLSLVKKNLRITVVEPNPDIRDLAENCASVRGNLKYVGAAIP
ncbi:MAG: 1-acyl-sn-glycerol-3-phosphate acyltransferase [Tannerella sp.]|jgi:1-acyl-sn-glycerol-3-phosphate acyltransferase|nr:1-acyl-sn-glycerol-3-phosphate acyltransferase [Tannerella sp.]